MRNEVLYMPKQHFVWNVCTAGEPPADQGEQAAGIEAGRQLRVKPGGRGALRQLSLQGIRNDLVQHVELCCALDGEEHPLWDFRKESAL